MNSKFSISGFGVSSTGLYSGGSGLPNELCDWRVDFGDAEAVELISRSSCVFDESLYVWGTGQDAIRVPGRRRAINYFDLASRSRTKPFIYTDGKVTNTQIVFSSGYVLAGCTLLAAKTWEVLENYEYSESQRNGCFGELVNSPVQDGFLYLGGLPRLPPRTLYHIDGPTREIRVLRNDITCFVAEPMSEVYYALRDGDLICENWRTGERIWKAKLLLDWEDEDLPIDAESRRQYLNSPKALALSGGSVFAHIGQAGIYRFDAQSGRFLEQFNTKWPRGRSNKLADHTTMMVADGILYRNFSLGRDLRGRNLTLATDLASGSTLFETEVEAGGDESALGIVGDLLFFNKTLDNVVWHIARDRFNGEVVWESKDSENYIESLQPAGNKLFFYSSSGSMICFSWDEPYYSPHRRQA